MKGCIFLFPKKDNLGITKIYKGITPTAIAAKIYNTLLLNRILSKIEKIFWKNQRTSQMVRQSKHRRNTRKNLEAILPFTDFSRIFDFIHRGKMGQILPAYRLPNIMMLQKNTNTPNGDTDYFDIVAGILQGDTLALYLFILCLDYVLRTSIDQIKENGFSLNKAIRRRYPSKSMTEINNADELILLVNTPAQGKFLRHSLEHAAVSFGLFGYAKKKRQSTVVLNKKKPSPLCVWSL